MITLLQRMDDVPPASTRSGGGVDLRPLPSITVLADAHEEEEQALEDWARGLDWVHWMFAGVRARMDRLLFVPKATQRAGIGLEWDAFAEGLARQTLVPQLVRAWKLAHAGDAAGLVEADVSCGETLSADAASRSAEAGAILLRNTRGARYQGLLGHYRRAQAAGLAPGHFVVVWAAVGDFFQLSLANVIAEYLRLEWDMATRHQHNGGDPVGRHSIAGLTSQFVHTQAQELRLVERD